MALFSDIMFWVFAATAVLPALLVLFSREIVHMACWLLLSLAGFARLYLQIGAGCLGFTQVVVYIGGILLLCLFGIMLTQKLDVPLRERQSFVFVFPIVLAGLFFIVGLVYIAGNLPWQTTTPAPGEFVADQIGAGFMRTFILAFEAVSVLLLVAMVGASYLVRRDVSRESDSSQSGEGAS